MFGYLVPSLLNSEKVGGVALSEKLCHTVLWFRYKFSAIVPAPGVRGRDSSPQEP